MTAVGTRGAECAGASEARSSTRLAKHLLSLSLLSCGAAPAASYRHVRPAQRSGSGPWPSRERPRDGCVASPFAASAATRSAAARSASSLTLSDSDSEPLDSPAELRGSGRRGRGRRGGRCRWHRGSLGLHNRARKVTEAHWQARAFRVPKRREVPYAKNKNSSRTWALVLPWNPSWVRVMTSMLTGRLTVVTQSDSHGDCNLTSEALCMATPEDMP